MFKKAGLLSLIFTLLLSIGISPTTFAHTENEQTNTIIIEERSGVRKPSLQKTDFAVGGGSIASPTSIKNTLQSSRITGYTRHGLEQALGREGKGVSNSAINSAVNNPTKITNQSNGNIKYENANAAVVLTSSGKVVTTWPKNHTAWRNK